MNLQLSPKAIERIKLLGKDQCNVIVRRGGCFGYTALFSFEIDHSSCLIEEVQDIKVYLSGDTLEDSLMIDYQSSLIKEGFVIRSLDSKNCCCNKSFGRKIDKGNCVN